MAESGFFGGSFMLTPRNEMIMRSNTGERSIDVKTMHISCQSDTYQPDHNYAGVIIYQYQRQVRMENCEQHSL